jgi:hypothetical protein
MSKLFAAKEVPLVSETVPLIEELEHKMLKIRENSYAPAVMFSPILRMAAHAALTVVEKYYALTDDCEVYRIAIGKSHYYPVTQDHTSFSTPVLCPDRKLQFLEKREWNSDDIETTKQLLVDRFNKNYASSQMATATRGGPQVPSAMAVQSSSTKLDMVSFNSCGSHGYQS